MKKTTTTIIIGGICTILLLGTTLFIMYKKSENQIYRENTTSNTHHFQNDKEPIIDENKKEDNKTNKPSESNNSSDANESKPSDNNESNSPSEASENIIKPENTNNLTEENKVILYMFHGSGCSFCKNALKAINEKKNTSYKNIEIRTFEVWGNKENSALLEKVADKLNIEVNGVPFFVIGSYSKIGYNEEMILNEINNAKKSKDYKDIVSEVINENKNLNTSYETIENN